MTNISYQKAMLKVVADALGDDLINEVVFVGGCTTGLLITDEFTKEQVRYTDDVDLIVDVIGYPAWASLQKTLRAKGFKDPIDSEDGVICRMLLGELKVDFMPVDEKTLGFSNRWYAASVQTAQEYLLTPDNKIKLIKPEYFIGTKLEAFRGRGNGDILYSRDIEDILNVIDGRESIVKEIYSAEKDLRQYIANQFKALIDEYYFELAVQSAVKGDKGREDLIFERLRGCITG
ncbi:hypothetical protein [Spartinivicinus poritis]|uniref:Nucleotidyl transferase AbiEii/AbiGii toxin family protein n=1 Tax=Spartinivicinus poritis TaxID=2994640 RepID=A0ABT5UKT0_9GAMM|nr:hypothetical protein [Spartinivicinus sp. A2-2]MDE1466092.1 hypothetical protein [Spartinivicinus sp. A2-2]